MPSKTTKAGSNKSHNRASSASSTAKVLLNPPFSRNKSADKINRNPSDVQHRPASPHPRLPQHRAQISPVKRSLLQVETAPDDDGWVSAESGAATPADYDQHDAPPSLDDHPDVEPLPSTTPRGDPQPHRPRPRPQSLLDLSRVNTMSNSTQDSPSSDSLPFSPPTPTHRTLQRPPSTRSGYSTRPHPLIRARSYAPTTPILTSSPNATHPHPVSPTPSPTSSPPKGPLSAVTRSPSSDLHYSQYHPRLKRHGSHSSLTSVATLPLPTTSSATASTTRVHGERQRTLSHASTSAALFSLTAATHPHPPSRPPSPVLTIAFPPINLHCEHAHVMIPPPLVPPHTSATAHRNPILEGLQRVAEAKARAGR